MKPKKKKEDTRGRHAMTTEQKERVKAGGVVDISEKGLKLSWITFLDAYIANGGNGQEAYKVAYPGVGDATARANAPRLLAIDSIKAELSNKLEVQKCTDEFVKNGLMEIATLYRGAKTIHAAVKSLEILGKMKGMLTDNHNYSFSGINPAQFLSPLSGEEKQKMDEDTKNLSRIVE